MNRRLLIGLLFLFAASESQVRADIVFSFTADGSQADYFVDVGQEVIVPVFLIETGAAVLSDQGLASIDFPLSFTSGPGNATVTDVSVNPLFPELQIATFNNASGSIDLAGATGLFDPPVFASGSTPSILLGEITFFGNQAGNVTTLSSLGDPDSGFAGFVSGGDFITTFPVELDDDVFGSIATATITTTTAVPEPTGLLAPVIGAFLLLSRRGNCKLRRKPS